jgi:hypothetical protein
MTQAASQLRSRLRQAQQQLATLLEEFLAREPLLPGSLYTLRRKCGKKNCRCAHGELHESTVLSYRGQGRPRNISPPAEQLATLRTLTEDYRRCRQARAQLVRWQRQVLALVDELEAARVRQGEADFQKLRAPAPVRKPRLRR